jgi:hypothetical protein
MKIVRQGGQSFKFFAGRKIGVSNIIRGLQRIGEYDPKLFE